MVGHHYKTKKNRKKGARRLRRFGNKISYYKVKRGKRKYGASSTK